MTHNSSATSGRLRAVAVALTIFALTGLVMHGSLTRVSVVVNGRHMAVPRGTTVGEALQLTDGIPCSGDLVSARDGRVVRSGAGMPAHVRLNDAYATTSTRLETADKVSVTPGADVIEFEREATITPPPPATEKKAAKLVALTFDDGPWPESTDAVLAMLERYDVPATFFMVGLYVKRWPETASHVAEQGHLVGNHTFHHATLTKVDMKQLDTELRWTNDVIKGATGVEPVWFRPPGGKHDGRVYGALKSRGMKPVLWTVDPQDWAGASAKQIADRVSNAVRPGAVVLLHDGGGDRGETVKALPMIIKRLRKQGYEFVTLDEIPKPRSRW